MKLVITFLFLIFLAGTCSYAQAPSNSRNAVATSVIRVSIPSFAVINLAHNKSKSVAYNATELKTRIQPTGQSKVVANDQWSVNVIRDKDFYTQQTKKRRENHKSFIHSYIRHYPYLTSV